MEYEEAKKIYWIHYTPRELELKISEDPLTKEKILDLWNKSIIEFYFDKDRGPKYGVVMFMGCINDIPKYSIFLGDPKYNNLDSQGDLIHEIIHVCYKTNGGYHPTHKDCNGFPISYKIEIENIVERETQEFVKNNPQFVRDLLLSIKQNRNI